MRDFAMGVRLAVGGGRTSWMRLVLGTIGIGLAVVVLLVFASLNHIMTGQAVRTSASLPSTTAINGVSPTEFIRGDMAAHGDPIEGAYLHGTGPNSPVPPGLAGLPGPNEIVVSPALADLLNSDAPLWSRFPEKIVGTIGEAGLTGPADLKFYGGTGPVPQASAIGPRAMNVYSFGAGGQQQPTDPTLLIVAVIGGVALLIPIFIFVSVSSRIAGAQRDRRLAALRLVGAGDWQVRRIAAAESLVGAGTGFVLGALAFLGIRQLAPTTDVLGWSTFTDDVVPSPALVALVFLLVPVLTVGTVLFAMRRTIIEPLGVVRDGKPVRRRLWWRVVPIVLGIGLLISAEPVGDLGSGSWIALVAVGASALLIGLPAILPWLLERITAVVHGGAPSWQLAIRRLQLDSGTAARVVCGVAVVLAGSIAIQLMLLSTANQYGAPGASPSAGNDWVTIDATPAAADRVAVDLASVPAADLVGIAQQVTAINADSTHDTITITSCQTIQRTLEVRDCRDGDEFLPSYPTASVKLGDVLTMIGAHDRSRQPKTLGTVTVPATATPATQQSSEGLGPILGDIVLTPKAAAALDLPADRNAEAWVLVDPNQADATDQIANGVGNLTWQVFVSDSGSDLVAADRKTFVTVRNLLNTGSLGTLLLAGISMLVLALEQVRERRRPLAVLAAAGVPRSVLARSLLWQIAVPMALAVLVAIGIGIGLAGLVIRMISMPLRIDWSTIGILAGATLVLVFLVTTLTLPTLRNAMRPATLRSE